MLFFSAFLGYFEAYECRAISSLQACQHPQGGFGGGHGQLAHLAPTYAAVNTLALFGDEEAFQIVDRKKMYQWMMSLKQADGGFLMHHGGEEDARYPKHYEH